MRRFLTMCFLMGLIILGVMYIIRFYTYETVTPIRGEFVSVEGQSLYITDHGDGIPVVFLHGFLFHSDTFFELASNPPEGYRYITIDWPGMGLSKKANDKVLNPADLALLLKLTLDKMELSKVIIVGHDFGGSVGMICAARYPSLVKGLVLIAPDSSVGGAVDILGDWWSWPIINQLWAAIRLDRNFVRWYVKQCWSDQDEHWSKYVERFYQPINYQNARKNLLQMNRSRKSFHYLPYEERIAVQTKIIWGGADKVSPVKFGHELVRIIPKADISIIDDAGHMLQNEKIEVVSQLIIDYLRTIDFSDGQK